MTANEQIQPPAPETTPEEDFHAQLRWWFEQDVLDMAFAVTRAEELIQILLPMIAEPLPEDITRKINFMTRDAFRANEMMECEDIDTLIASRALWLKPYLAEMHVGDCTAFSASCSRCLAEDMYRIPSTVTWKNKHEGYSLYYRAKEERGELNN